MAVSGEPESSDSLRTFGAVVQGLREHHGLSREELGDVVGFSKHTVASVELGRRMPDEEFVEAAELVLGNTGALRRAAGFVERQAGLADWFQRWARLEQTAITLYMYECRMLPGLLQAEAYARQLFVDELPPLTDEEIEVNWAARAERQKLLRELPNTAFSFVIEESVLLRQTGGLDVTREAIDHLLALGRLRNIAIQIMPLVKWSHSGLHGPMQLLETPQHKWFAYLEAPGSGQLISDAKAISALQSRYASMRSQALSSEDSVGLLQRIRGDL
ncbi:helix-turn-helix domain-containing protein [Streptomyces antibioticus]|uniref:DNA-binding protein n=1 Tax=Streptomyces antibioticus TaxID=1890 RepID=A0AAE6Y8N3_STRAT|nr:helix-turn-helix transcriptional regulator [Streptomyces antibioticus]OOQ52335.1 DNA-binding protein [Streptomyces antibioticus]QIT44339.1 helix-turn-helix domain-containing protein [Streptomyces antibioticus]